jgi:hypothetical protein
MTEPIYIEFQNAVERHDNFELHVHDFLLNRD